MKLTYRDIIWFAIVTLIVIYLSRCHGEKADKLRDSVTKLVESSKLKDSIYLIDRQQLENQIAVVMDQAHNAAAGQARAELQLGQSIAINNRLSGAVKAAKLLPVDSTFIAVSPKYVDYCDSLAVFSDTITLNFENYKIRNTRVLLAKDTIIKLHQNQVANERAAYEQCKRDFNSIRNFYAQAESKNKLRNQIYLGAELIGNQYTLIQNVGAVLSLKTKSNKLWQVSGGLQSNGGYYGRINGNFLIRINKK